MSDEQGPGYPGGDPFIDPSDPEAVEREKRRREREAKRAGKAAKRKQKEAAAPPPPPPKEPPPPTHPRTPEQEFWDEPAEPVTPPPLPTPEVGAEPPSSERAEKGRKRLLGRRKAKRGAAAAGGAAAASAASDAAAAPPPSGPPTGETPVPPQDAPSTGETPAAPPTGEQRRPGAAAGAAGAAAARPTGEEAVPAPGPPTTEQPIADAGPPTAEQPRPEIIPVESEAAHAHAEEAPQVDPGSSTADTPQLDPNAPRREQAPPPRPVEQTGAGDWEPPPPRDDWGFDEDEDFHDEGDPNMAGAARTGRRHGEGGNRGGGFRGALLRHPFRILFAVVLILILVFLNSLFQPFHGDGHGKVVVDIPKGSSVGEVGDLLEKKGVLSGGFIASGSTLFQARVTIAGKRSDLFAGKFTMKEDMSYGDAINELSQEPKPAEEATKPGVVTVTIPEGQSRPITAKLVKEDGINGNYLKATKKSKVLNPEDYGGKNVKDLEGFLFPDTWEFKTNKPVKDLVTLQLEDFKKQIKKVKMKYAKSKNLT
ncbi:MAG TPA: endolytic transglycosylase MltG, partial [Solirubrobacterales bacterium]|nr:endolytic transglycosylase MltG [Solirubrobacterales bacterium]